MAHKFPDNLPVLDYPSVADIPPEVIAELQAQHAADQEQAADRNAEVNAVRDYETLLADARATLGRNEGAAVCRLQGYEGITAFYDLSVEFDRTLTRPFHRTRTDSESLSDFVRRALAPYKKALAEWVTLFVLRIEPFELTTREGEALPNPQDDPAVYSELVRDHSEFMYWLAYAGFDEAVKGAIKNSPKTSEGTTSKS